ncbi:MAG: polyprenol monophosphomannose synthase [Planctomycetaceae bacterium]|jgi:dolichol-phosphate mannosyltransferase|nr:polyprenol monophosphomannose synthase [Planctomycetaceae bacterium]MBT4887167.1 polyprenol monophosphomannose synthase [Planctomycetaceae bacterium]
MHQIASQWPPGTVVIQVATYNEAASIGQLLQSIHRILPDAQIVIIDDNSPDGTAQIVTQQAEKHSYIHLLLRIDRRGLGTATLEGLTFAHQRGAGVVIHLDGDLSHNASDLPRLLEALTPANEEPFDIVIGSRRVHGGKTIGWSMKRHIASWLVCWFTRVILRVPVRDASSGFRALRLQYISTMNLDNLAEGYAFFEDFLWRAHRSGARITEIPITFTDRTLGKSKVNSLEMLRGARDLLKIAVQTWVK